MISARKAKQLDATTMFTYSHANTPLGQSERAYYLSYLINMYGSIFYKCKIHVQDSTSSEGMERVVEN